MAENVTVPELNTAPQTVVGSTPQAEFPFEFPFWDPADIIIRVDGVAISDADFDVEGYFVQNGEPVEGGFGSGKVTLHAPVSNVTVTVDRFVVGARNTQLSRAGPMPASALNADFNKATARQQDLGRRTEILTELPDPSLRQDTLLGFDETGGLIVLPDQGLPAFIENIDTQATAVLDATQAGVEATLDAIEDIVNLAPLSNAIPYLAAIRDPAGKLFPTHRADGHAMQVGPGGPEPIRFQSENDERYPFTEGWPMAPLIQGERPYAIEVDRNGLILKAYTREGSVFILSDAGLVRVGSTGAAAAIPTMANEAYDFGKRDIRYAYSGSVCLIQPTLGQSNGSAQNQSADALIATTSMYPSALMFAGGVRRWNMGRTTTTVPLVESSDSNSRETSASGLANQLIRNLFNATGVTAQTLSFNAALGGMPYRGLKRGSGPYKTFLESLADAVSVCRAKGWTPIVPFIDWMQGESDAGGPNYTDGGNSTRSVGAYKASMRQFDRDIAGDVKALTGQATDPVILFQQIARDGGATWGASVQQAQRELHGVGNLRLVGPIYQHPFVSAGEDGIHLNSRGQNRRGQDVARAGVAEVFGQGWSPVLDESAVWISTTQIDITFTVPLGPLVIDTTGTIVATTGLTASKGFLFRDASTGTETAVTDAVVQADGVTVRLTLASAFTGREGQVGYARARTSGVFDGPVSGARGLLRDSTAQLSIYDGVAARNWCPAFLRNVGRP